MSIFFKKILTFPSIRDKKKANENRLITEIIGFLKTVIFGLKIPRGQPRVGSIPTSGTSHEARCFSWLHRSLLDTAKGFF